MLRLMQKGMLILFTSSCFLLTGMSALAQDIPSDYQDVLKSLDRKGDFKAGVLKVNIPRSDLKITIQGVPTPTAFGFGGWIAMTKRADGSDVGVGLFVRLKEEVNPVMSALPDNGIDVPPLHTFFFGDDPPFYFRHFQGRGRAAARARRVNPALALIGHVPSPAAKPFPATGTVL